MNRIRWIAAAAIAAAVALYALWPPPEPPVRPDAVPAGAKSPPAPAAPPAPDDGAPLAAPEPQASPSVPDDSDRSVEEPVVRMRLEPKLTGQSLSEVPHDLVGAWDEQADSPEVGTHRVFVAIVEPSASDAEIEALLRDVSDRHRDAEVLDVRVYDSADAASRAGWIGDRRLVGEVKRNDRLRYEAVTVRGERVGP